MSNSKSNFIDYVKIYFKSGNGGKGSAHFLGQEYSQKEVLMVAMVVEGGISS